MKKTVGILLLLVAYGLLYPGVTQPILTLQGSVDKADVVQIGKDLIIESPQTPKLIDDMADAVLSGIRPEGRIQVYEKTRSILGTSRDLYESNHEVVAILIVVFSIVVPVVKLVMLLFASLRLSPALTASLLGVSGHISKWSMADVFLIGIFIAFLAANSIDQSRDVLQVEATLGSGFYYFLGYCLISILSSQFLAPATRTAKPEGE